MRLPNTGERRTGAELLLTFSTPRSQISTGRNSATAHAPNNTIALTEKATNSLSPVINKHYLAVVQRARHFTNALITQLSSIICLTYLSRSHFTHRHKLLASFRGCLRGLYVHAEQWMGRCPLELFYIESSCSPNRTLTHLPVWPPCTLLQKTPTQSSS